jgi:hypothetical protein
MERGAARRVTGHEDDPRRTGHFERGAIAERRDLLDPRNAQQPVCGREDQELHQWRDLDRAQPLGRIGDLAAGERSVQLVHEDRRVSIATDPLGEPDVVGMAVGQDHCPDVIERAIHHG